MPIQTNDMTIRVVVADDHQHVRSGICRILGNDKEIEVIGEASNGVEALDKARELAPDLLLVDVQMPEMTGLQVARRLQKEGSPVRILAISAYDDSEFILGMLEAGASGYLTKDEAPFMVNQAVRGIMDGETTWVSQRVAERLGLKSPQDNHS